MAEFPGYLLSVRFYIAKNPETVAPGEISVQAPPYEKTKTMEKCKHFPMVFLFSRSALSLRETYSMIDATVPDPTVRPPSRIANLRPSSIATGWISSTVIVT